MDDAPAYVIAAHNPVGHDARTARWGARRAPGAAVELQIKRDATIARLTLVRRAGCWAGLDLIGLPLCPESYPCLDARLPPARGQRLGDWSQQAFVVHSGPTLPIERVLAAFLENNAFCETARRSEDRLQDHAAVRDERREDTEHAA